METKVAAVAAAPDTGNFPAKPSVIAAPSSETPVETGPDPVQMRLVIEEDQATGSYVYKTVNRLTGEVIQQLPRADVLKLRGELRYAAGTVIRTEA